MLPHGAEIHGERGMMDFDTILMLYFELFIIAIRDCEWKVQKFVLFNGFEDLSGWRCMRYTMKNE